MSGSRGRMGNAGGVLGRQLCVLHVCVRVLANAWHGIAVCLCAYVRCKLCMRVCVYVFFCVCLGVIVRTCVHQLFAVAVTDSFFDFVCHVCTRLSHGRLFHDLLCNSRLPTLPPSL